MITKPDACMSLNGRLARLEAERDIALARLIEAACDHRIGALIHVGSLGRGHGDAFSDLDLIAVPLLHTSPSKGRDIFAAAFGGQALAAVTAPRNAPVGGDYQAVCVQTTDAALWIDIYVWPRQTARVPADGNIVFDHIGVDADPRSCTDLLAAHTDPARPAHPAGGATSLLRVAVAAKYLARGDHKRMAAKVPQTAALTFRPASLRLHAILDTVTEPELTTAVAATRNLVDLAVEQASRLRLEDGTDRRSPTC
ncbi:hypothetical protein AB0M47_27455 [Hamadaea sp. NPDC051192]|uniref:hypothetical protein n=1 Tax=Hamadaea sp. NPDC051192 TaxID=3154940 RepID=UPI003420F100